MQLFIIELLHWYLKKKKTRFIFYYKKRNEQGKKNE